MTEQSKDSQSAAAEDAVPTATRDEVLAWWEQHGDGKAWRYVPSQMKKAYNDAHPERPYRSVKKKGAPAPKRAGGPGPRSPRVDTPVKPEDYEWPPPWVKDRKPFQIVSGGLPTLGKRSR